MSESDVVSLEKKISTMASSVRTNDDAPLFLLSKYCSENKIAIEKNPKIPILGAVLSRIKSAEYRYKISLPTVPIRSYQRFCIAHEIAHVAIEENKLLNQVKRINHWQLEEICDHFARLLLVSNIYLDRKLRNLRPQSSVQWLKFCDDVATECKIPWMQAGKRIADWKEGRIAYLRLCWRENDISSPPYIASTSLKGRRGTNRKIERGSSLCRVVDKLSSSKMHIGAWSGSLREILNDRQIGNRDLMIDDLLGVQLEQLAIRVDFGKYPCIYVCSPNRRPESTRVSRGVAVS